MQTNRACGHWKLKPNYISHPYERKPIDNCGNCGYYIPDTNCIKYQ